MSEITSDSVLVAVRVRPFNDRERRIKGGTQLIVDMKGGETLLKDPETSGNARTFSFDYSYWSHDEHHHNFVSQQQVFDTLGTHIIKNAFEGYNTSLFAYGQTGSGKTYTMMGSEADLGIIPRVCKAIFDRIYDETHKNDGVNRNYRVETSMVEIYNERIRDLFNPTNPLNSTSGLKVRENPQTGPYIEGMESCIVHNANDILRLMDEGNKLRTITKTNMNDTSSRAHTIFQIILASSTESKEGNESVFTERMSTINLIDLAGSERAEKSGATGEKLKEGAAINVSLTALGNVINKLSEKAENPTKKVFVPYRNSVLTWLLKESLGGNSKTIMIATISPSDYNYQETLSTLRYASRAKSIKNKAKINEDPNAAVVRELRDEIARLKSLVEQSNTSTAEDEEKIKLREQLASSQNIIEQLQKSTEDKERRTQEIERARRKVLEEAGISFTDQGEGSKNVPHIINLNEDPMMSGQLTYCFSVGDTRIGRDNTNNIVLNGLQIKPFHCVVSRSTAEVKLTAIKDATVYVNGKVISGEEILKGNDRIIVGSNHVFRYIDPNVLDAKQLDWGYAQEELAFEQKRAIESVVEEKEREIEENMLLKLKEIEENFEKEKSQQQAIIDRQVKEIQEHKTKLDQMDEMKKKKKKGFKDTVRNVISSFQNRFKKDTSNKVTSKNISRNRIDENLVRLLPMIKEANDIVKEFNKNLRYDLKILVKNAEPMLNVQAVDRERKKTTLWTVEEFETRLVQMREKLASAHNPLVVHADDHTDPFYGTASDVLASAKLDLKYLAKRQAKEEQLPLIDPEGEIRGHLIVALVPLVPGDDTMKQIPDPVQSSDDLLGSSLHFLLKIKAIKEWPLNSRDNHISFRFYTEKPVNTAAQNGVNMAFNFHRRYCVRTVNEDLIEYLEDGYVQFDVVGEPIQEEGKWNSIKGSLRKMSLGTPTPKRKEIPDFSNTSPRHNSMYNAVPSEQSSKPLGARKLSLGSFSSGSSTKSTPKTVIPPKAAPLSSYNILLIRIESITDLPFSDGTFCCKLNLKQGSEEKEINEKTKTKIQLAQPGEIECNDMLSFDITELINPNNKLSVKLLKSHYLVLKHVTTVETLYNMFQKGVSEVATFDNSITKLKWSATFDFQ